MTYYRDYVKERLEIVKTTVGESYSKFDEKDIINQIKSEITDKQLEDLNVPLVVNDYGKNGKCKTSLKNINVGVFKFNELPFIRAMIDGWIIDEDFTLDECIDMLRAEYVNENISKGMKYGAFVRKFDELESEAKKLGFEISLKK